MDWHKSSYCHHTSTCVEVCETLVRDSADPDSPVLAFTPAAWQEFIEGLR